MNLLLLLPLLIPQATAALCLLAWRRTSWQRALNLLGSLALFFFSIVLAHQVWRQGIQVTALGDWPAPFGIVFVADFFSAMMVVLAGLIGVLVACYSLGSMDRGRERLGYYPLCQILLMGICGAFLTGDMFNLYVWFEVMLIASFILLALGGEKGQMEGAIKYVTLNLLSSAIFLAAVGMLYGLTGSLNMADLAVRFSQSHQDGMILILAMLFLVTFGIKAAIFPLFFWLPASYHTPPPAVSALFAGLLTKVGVYSLIRVFTLMFLPKFEFISTLLLGVAMATMVTGVLGAAAQFEFRRILSFHSISQIGYMILGLAFFTPLALLGSIFYIVHHLLVKTNLFFISGVSKQITGSYQLKKMGGLYSALPGLTLLFALSAFSLSGIPPLSGFFAKFTLLQVGVELKHYGAVAVALLVGLWTLFSMTKIWAEVFWKSPPLNEQGVPLVLVPTVGRQRVFLYLPIGCLALATVVLGLGVGVFWPFFEQAARQLMEPQDYIRAVLGGVA